MTAITRPASSARQPLYWVTVRGNEYEHVVAVKLEIISYLDIIRITQRENGGGGRALKHNIIDIVRQALASLCNGSTVACGKYEHVPVQLFRADILNLGVGGRRALISNLGKQHGATRNTEQHVTRNSR